MIKKLRKDKKLTGHVENLKGDVSGIWGEVPSYLSGDINTRLIGDITGWSGKITGWSGEISFGLKGEINSGLSGDITGVYGDCTGIKGNLNECGLTDEDRKKGVNIKDLLGE